MIRQEMLNIIYLSFIPEVIESKFGLKSYSQHALIRTFTVIQCEHFREITSLLDFLSLNLKIAQLCGFKIIRLLPSDQLCSCLFNQIILIYTT